jgi:hypothetical protein
LEEAVPAVLVAFKTEPMETILLLTGLHRLVVAVVVKDRILVVTVLEITVGQVVAVGKVVVLPISREVLALQVVITVVAEIALLHIKVLHFITQAVVAARAVLVVLGALPAARRAVRAVRAHQM